MISFKGLVAVIAALIAHSVAAQPTHLLKIATLAPEGSSYAKALRAIDADVRRETGGNVGFKIYPGGVQGEEKVVLRKMRIGQLHGGNFGGLGISQTFPDVPRTGNALPLPRLCRSRLRTRENGRLLPAGIRGTRLCLARLGRHRLCPHSLAATRSYGRGHALPKGLAATRRTAYLRAFSA